MRSSHAAMCSLALLALVLACQQSASLAARVPQASSSQQHKLIGEDAQRADVNAVVKQAAANQNKQRKGNDRPLIGVMTQPCHDCPGMSYIAAAFVKWVESAGGRVVPIRFYSSPSELYRLFRQINGLVFPGGLTWLWLDSPYVKAARLLFDWAVESNKAGDPFPIHGTCLGFQLLHILASNISRNDMLVDTDSTSHATTLKFWNKDAKESKMFGGLSDHLLDALESDEYNIALENHMYGMPPEMYEKFPVLSDWYTILSTTKDRNGIEYVSTVEGKQFPFFGTQWHPEKPPFEFGLDAVPHSIEAIKVSQHLGSVFVEAAKQSSHKPDSKEEELELLIYDTCPIFSARFEVPDEENYDGPDMTYYFDKKGRPPSGPEDDDDSDKPHDKLRAKHPEGYFLG